MCFDTVHMGIDWRPVPGSENHYEMVLVKTPEAEPSQGIFAQRSDITAWPMHDIWAKHPTKPNLWRFVGRDDDLIAFAGGSKLYPTPYEALHSGKPFVKAAVLAGQQHYQAVLLLHVEQDIISNEGENRLLEAIWPGIEEVNSRAPRNAQIAKTHVVISLGGKGFQWTDKGTVKRKATIAGWRMRSLRFIDGSETRHRIWSRELLVVNDNAARQWLCLGTESRNQRQPLNRQPPQCHVIWDPT